MHNNINKNDPSTSYPIVLTGLAQARCVVVGGGRVAERKVRGLLEAGARPVVISPQLTSGLTLLAATGSITHLARTYASGDLAGATLVFAATNDQAVNALVAAEAQGHGLLANIADNPATSSFYTVATIRRGDLLLTVSTAGRSPAFAAQLRAELAARFGPEYAQALEAAATRRAASRSSNK